MWLTLEYVSAYEVFMRKQHYCTKRESCLRLHYWISQLRSQEHSNAWTLLAPNLLNKRPQSKSCSQRPWRKAIASNGNDILRLTWISSLARWRLGIESFPGITRWSQYQTDNSEERLRQVQWQLPHRNCCCALGEERQAVWRQQEEISDSPTGVGSKIRRTAGTRLRRTQEYLSLLQRPPVLRKGSRHTALSRVAKNSDSRCKRAACYSGSRACSAWCKSLPLRAFHLLPWLFHRQHLLFWLACNERARLEFFLWHLPIDPYQTW